MAKRKRTNNDLQNITHKTKDQATRIQLKTQVFRKDKQFLLHTWHPLLLLLKTRWKVMNEDRFGLWLRQKEHIRGRSLTDFGNNDFMIFIILWHVNYIGEPGLAVINLMSTSFAFWIRTNLNTVSNIVVIWCNGTSTSLQLW